MASAREGSRVAPTRRGKILLVESVLLYAFARAVSIDELYAVTLAAFILPLASLVFVALRRPSVTLSRTVGPRRVFAGGTIRFGYSVRNLATGSSPPLIIDDPAPASLGGGIRVALPGFEVGRVGSVSLERRAPRRGRFAVGPLRLHVEDPFGLASASVEAAGNLGLVVYPRIEVLHESTPHDPRSGAGSSNLFRLASSGEEFFAIRDWEYGDDHRTIHWRSSAKQGRLQTRQNEVRPQPRATVMLDPRFTDPDALEWAVSAAASVVWELARQGFGLRLVVPGTAVGPARWGREAADPLLAALAVQRSSTAPDIVATARAVASRSEASGVLVAVLPARDAASLTELARARTAYDWAGAVLVDEGSFAGISGRARAEEDQRLAEAERIFGRTRWRVTTAGEVERIATAWQRLTEAGASRRSSPSLHL